MRSIRIALVAALAVLAPALASAPAHAGGPTSALLVVPGESRTAALYYDDPEYIRLNGLLGGDGPLMGQAEPPAGADDQGPAGSSSIADPGVTITWLMHDVAVWRVDRVYLSGKAGGWVATTTNLGGTGDVVADAPFWRRIEHPEALATLLDQLGVGPSGAGRVVAVAPVVPSVVERTAPAAEPSAAAGWWWGAAGLVLGAVLGGAAAPVLRRRRADADPAEPEAPEQWDAELGEEEHPMPARGA